MTIITSPTNPSKAKLDTLIIACPEFEASNKPWVALDQSLAELCDKADPHQSFMGKEGSMVQVPTWGKVAAKSLVLVGLGSTETPSVYQKVLAKVFRQLPADQIRRMGFLDLGKRLASETIIHAMEEGSYYFRSFHPDPEKRVLRSQTLELLVPQGDRDSLLRAEVVVQAVRYAKSLANQPPNLFSPLVLAREAALLAKRRKLHHEVWSGAKLKREGFGGIVAVGQGSANPPCFVRLDYRGGGTKQPPFVVVGKAITFDTGGISIKPSDKMDEMKYDKCGGIAVLGILDAVAGLKLPINVTGLISSAENMPSSKAYRPGDLVETLSGKYVEVLNTDAEGRIVLADALTYAHRLKPQAVIDLATLTGACIICFGHESAAILGNDQKLIDELKAASERTGEKIWQLPLWKEYQEKVKSDIGYVKNTAGREGGTITAACFLNAFVDEKIPWAHLDIAGMAWTSKEEPHRAKGATAFGVRLVVDWLSQRGVDAKRR